MFNLHLNYLLLFRQQRKWGYKLVHRINKNWHPEEGWEYLVTGIPMMWSLKSSTTTNKVSSIGWKPIFSVGYRNRYNLIDTKNELFMVPVGMGRHQKSHLWCRFLKWTGTKNRFSKNKKMTEPRSRPVRPRSRPYNLPPSSPSLGCWCQA
jgi:hypothetical protein